jgi:hypothetical protein
MDFKKGSLFIVLDNAYERPFKAGVGVVAIEHQNGEYIKCASADGKYWTTMLRSLRYIGEPTRLEKLIYNIP